MDVFIMDEGTDRLRLGKADLRAAMDGLGLQRKALASLCGVSTNLLNAWLDPHNASQPPVWIWSTLRMLHDRQQKMADDLWDAGFDGEPLPIYASQKHYDAVVSDRLPYGFANHAALMAAHDLRADGKDVSFFYPEPNV